MQRFSILEQLESSPTSEKTRNQEVSKALITELIVDFSTN